MTSQSPRKSLKLVSPRGFCAGVERAISIVDRMLDLVEGPLYVRKEIVHNRAVVDDFTSRGVVFVDELDEVPAGATVVFSAHGVSPAVRADADARGLRVVDATCPLVTKVHKQVVGQANRGRHIVLIGHAGHDEVEGTMGEAPDSIDLVTSEDDARTLTVPAGKDVYYVTQTTLSVDETHGIVQELQARIPDLQGPAKSDICYATQNRQDGVKRLVADGIDHLLVVGSPNSSNSRRLCEVAEKAGVPAQLVGGPDDLDLDELCQKVNIGLTAGASAPEHLVQSIVACFRGRGWDVEDVVVMEEDVRFELPPEVRGVSSP
ncbi:MAG TPA: 4-hydroxy-3-methylbut-2-enyl diphosphate reductase [Candidatus Krumholzibacteria bacterium]|nr:4-hydroxy-3-methylbut-2-enyl diphosphate reductase [Candidatus Krumholzibacteria bacterium]HRX51765.1 4-hydroxy-3-methylbut-2-enyl diphosphate reductase [Candidatus Krumholzibacteria bacterium]